MRPIVFAVVLCAVLLAESSSSSAEAQFGLDDLFVAPNGNDVWSGRLAAPNAQQSDGPLATIEAAVQAVRRQRRSGKTVPATVWVRRGAYQIDKPVNFGPADSGPITYAAYPNEQPVLDAGRRVACWKDQKVNSVDVWVADVGGLVRKNGPFRSLFVNGQRRPRAFFPKQGFYRIAEVPGITFDADLFARTNCSDSEMALHAANCVRCFTSKSRLGWRRCCCWVGGPVGAAAAQGLGGPPGATEVEDCSEEALRTALAAGGRVVFVLDGTISVTSTVAITNNALLDGNGHQVTISGNNETGVFSVPAGVTFVLADLTIANGSSYAGAGVRNDGGTLGATNCVFFNNYATGADGTDGSGGAIYNPGSLDVTQCVFGWNLTAGGNALNGGYTSAGAGQGGAIYNSGNMVLDSSLLASNSVGSGSIGSGGDGGAGSGGAVANSGTGVLVNCTLAWNQGTSGSGGEGMYSSEPLSPGGPGGDGGDAAGALANVNGITALTNGTVAFNTGGGGAGGSGGYAFIGSQGAPGLGGGAVGGIQNAGTVSLVNCNLASNSGVSGWRGDGFATPGVGFGNLDGTFNDLGHNLSSDASVLLTGPGSLVNMNPNLGPIQDNGGPTWTLALLPGSSQSAPPTARPRPQPISAASRGPAAPRTSELTNSTSPFCSRPLHLPAVGSTSRSSAPLTAFARCSRARTS